MINNLNECSNLVYKNIFKLYDVYLKLNGGPYLAFCRDILCRKIELIVSTLPGGKLPERTDYLMEQNISLARRDECLLGLVILQVGVIHQLLGAAGADDLIVDDPRVWGMLERNGPVVPG
jgi:hypothetical protein